MPSPAESPKNTEMLFAPQELTSQPELVDKSEPKSLAEALKAEKIDREGKIEFLTLGEPQSRDFATLIIDTETILNIPVIKEIASQYNQENKPF